MKLEKFLLSDLEKIIEIEKTSFLNRQPFSKNYFKKIFKKYPQGFIVAKEKREIIGGEKEWEKIGFKILKKIKNYYQNGENAYLMEKKLGE